MDKIAVIGSNSFSGSHCVSYFLENSDFEVIGISRSPEYPPVMLPYLYKKNKRPARFKFYQLDLNKNPKQIINRLDREKPDIIVNFAAQGIVPLSWNSPEDWFRTNCLGIVNLTNGLREKKYLKKYIQVSTPEIYGPCKNFKETLTYYNPSTPYAASKAAADLFLVTLYKKFGFPVCFTRSANVYGPHQQLFRIIPKSVISIKKGQKIPLHQGGLISRSFVHITDVMRGIHKIINQGRAGEVYHFATGQNITIKELVSMICKKIGISFEKSVKKSGDRPGQDDTYDLNFAKTSRELDWKPTIELESGLDGIITWINESWSKIQKLPLEYSHKK
ncbi:MAG: GDP-mannose 4,6-dehydratase [Patescibacteria group bacterium]